MLSALAGTAGRAAHRALHHERLDGRGFDGLRGEKIPIEARIVAVADAFDAMTTRRPYRESRPRWTPCSSCAGWRHAARPGAVRGLRGGVSGSVLPLSA
jgi:hypothetical protein